MKNKIYIRVRSLLASPNFFLVALIFYVIESTWIALSGAFSMPYDENTHITAIRLYATRLLPFWSSPPDTAFNLGAVHRDPSYLYHYLLSFPYRVIDDFITSEAWQVIFLRFINIALFGLGLIIFKKVLLKTGASTPLAHTVLALLILTPVTPFLAAQINYDNAFFLLIGLALLLTMQFTEKLHTTKKIPVDSLIILASTCMLASLVKFSFLPITVALAFWVSLHIYHLVNKSSLKKVWANLKKSFKNFSYLKQVLLIALLLLSTGLFTERYGVNFVRYGTPTPECNQVLSIERCQHFGPWARNYQAHQDKTNGLTQPTNTDPISYTLKTWLRIMTYQMFFAFNGQIQHFQIGAPLPLPFGLGILLAVSGFLLVVRWQKYLRKNYKLDLVIFVTVFYVALLWLQEYMDFRHLGLAVAIQGRYLIGVLPIIYLLIALAFARTFKKAPFVKAALAVIAIGILLLQGGGPSVFIMRSNPNWLWPDQRVISVNENAKKVFGKIIIGE